MNFSPFTMTVWARVVAALETNDRIRMLAEDVNDLSFSLVAPLGADYYSTWHFFHLFKLSKNKQSRQNYMPSISFVNLFLAMSRYCRFCAGKAAFPALRINGTAAISKICTHRADHEARQALKAEQLRADQDGCEQRVARRAKYRSIAQRGSSSGRKAETGTKQRAQAPRRSKTAASLPRPESRR